MSNAASLHTITPIQDRVLLQVIEREEISKGGIYIPKTARDETVAWQAKVIAVGPGRILENGKLLEPGVKKDDKVILGKYMGTEIEVDNIKYVVVREGDILAVVE